MHDYLLKVNLTVYIIPHWLRSDFWWHTEHILCDYSFGHVWTNLTQKWQLNLNNFLINCPTSNVTENIISANTKSCVTVIVTPTCWWLRKTIVWIVNMMYYSLICQFTCWPNMANEEWIIAAVTIKLMECIAADIYFLWLKPLPTVSV